MTTTYADRYAADWLDKARFARRCNELGEPWPNWSTGQLLVVALILQDMRKLTDLDYTEVDALLRIRRTYGMHERAAAAQWFADLRARL